MYTQRAAASAALLLGLLMPRGAAATGGGERSFIGVGVTAGAATAREKTSPIVGVEGSFVHFAEFAWAGAYADTVYAFGEQHARLSLGPELGVGPLGLDGGYVVAVGRGGIQQGISVRPMLTLGYVAIYYRFEELGGRSGYLNEVGVLLKGFKGL